MMPVNAFEIHSCRKVGFHPNRQGQQVNRFGIEVIQHAQMQVARFIGAGQRSGVRGNIPLNFDLRILEDSINDLRLKRLARASFAPIIEQNTALETDFVIGRTARFFSSRSRAARSGSYTATCR